MGILQLIIYGFVSGITAVPLLVCVLNSLSTGGQGIEFDSRTDALLGGACYKDEKRAIPGLLNCRDSTTW